MTTIGEILRERREELGMRQEDVAKVAKIGGLGRPVRGKPRRHLGADHVSKLERGVWSPNPATLAKLAKALKTTPAELRAEAARREGARGSDHDRIAKLLARVVHLEAEVKKLKRGR